MHTPSAQFSEEYFRALGKTLVGPGISEDGPWIIRAPGCRDVGAETLAELWIWWEETARALIGQERTVKALLGCYMTSDEDQRRQMRAWAALGQPQHTGDTGYTPYDAKAALARRQPLPRDWRARTARYWRSHSTKRPALLRLHDLFSRQEPLAQRIELQRGLTHARSGTRSRARL